MEFIIYRQSIQIKQFKYYTEGNKSYTTAHTEENRTPADTGLLD